jgi:group I intron endonuclease
MAKAGIYVILNRSSNKSYVGQSVDLGQRMRRHKHHLRAGRHVNRHLQAAWDKDGEGAFEFVIVAEVSRPDREGLVSELNRLEKDTILRRGSFGPGGYNMDSGGLNRVVSAETKARLKESRRGQKPYVRTDAMRRALRQANLGKRLSPETRLKLSMAAMGKPAWNKGKRYKTRPCTESRRRLISLAQMGSKNHNFGKTTPESVKDKIRAANCGSKCHLAKLTEDKVAVIKRRLQDGESGSALAKEYGVAPTQISCIRLGKTWRHVEVA